jgi:hypothetical protein
MVKTVARLTNGDDRLAAEGTTILRFVDGKYPTRDGTVLPLGTHLFQWGMRRGVQCFGDETLLDEIVEQPGEPLPDPEELNAKIPRSEWGTDLNGNPRPPWQMTYAVYLLNPETGDGYSFLSSTTGGRIAYERLQSRIRNMKLMRGSAVAPLIELDTRQMPTKKYGPKPRPEFSVVEWRELGDSGPALLPAPVGPEGNGSEGAEAKPEKPAIKKKAVTGKAVTEPTLKEELNDDIPW